MKKHLFIFLGLSLLLWQFFSPPKAQAHFDATDKTITAEFHIEPYHNPIPGKPATLYFLFNDDTKRFSLAKCNCIVTVTEQGKEIFSQPLLEKKEEKLSVWGYEMSYTFPKRGTYTITLTGTPNEPNAFQPFTVSWDFRVKQQGTVSQSPEEKPEDPTFIYFAIAWLGIPLLVGLSTFLIVRSSK